MKAMLLAAGRGGRLRPLTDKVPKSLIQVGELTLIEYHLLSLKAAGISEIVINLSYRAKQIARYLGKGTRYGVTIEYSYEGEKPLGTGGGVLQALKLLGEQPFWLVSSDVWSLFDFSSIELAATDLAHLVLVPNPEFHLEGDYALSAQNRLLREGDKRNYAGLAILHPRLFTHCDRGCFSLSPMIDQAIADNKAAGTFYAGPWFNVGTIEELTKLKQAIAGLAPSPGRIRR